MLQARSNFNAELPQTPVLGRWRLFVEFTLLVYMNPYPLDLEDPKPYGHG